MLRDSLKPYRYLWPSSDVHADPHWQAADGARFSVRRMPESPDEMAGDSRWPAFFPSPICVVTAADGSSAVLERVVGPSIVNRFPYVMALKFCARSLSKRHYARRAFLNVLESGRTVAVQFLEPGSALDRVLGVIASGTEADALGRPRRTGLATRRALTSDAPVFVDAYLVYEARLVEPSVGFQGEAIYAQPWMDVGSHRMVFLEITAIQLRRDIAEGRTQILWRSLPAWSPKGGSELRASDIEQGSADGRYQKGYTPHYAFPSAGTIAFSSDAIEEGMAVLHLPPRPLDQVELDNDRSRWPCFFPSSVGMITTWAEGGRPNLMPCGSTSVVSRHPLIIAPCVSYAAINERYAPRATLELIRRNGAFGCGVPYIDDAIIEAIKYAGNISLPKDTDKVARAGLAFEEGELAPVLPALPIHFECRVVEEVPLGTHVMFLGEARRILVRGDVTPDNPIEWCPWADVGTPRG